ncbi:LysR family transcriptional regulator [Salipiger mangrovisoli]|uniref:LysR family transcriptional regulator n=1 Tax=Salipiger mangrovisoli TaxID=2865933 RepID=A0ABR9XBL3_9RHOB|nr:LysR family transcriptional regulator [Salipiger mangrovisoli]MBE9640882.1 LysR family transcriptional regulator [Salipiger mangrovisoli]
MSRRLTYLQYLPAFEAVARKGSVRAAAEELNLSPGAVSLQIRNLSDTLGVTLFERSGRALRLSRPGRHFATSIAAGLSQIETAERVARETTRSGETVSLRVSVPTGLGVAWLSAALISFAQDRRVQELAINEARTAPDVDWKVNDVAVVYGNPPFPDLHWRLLHDVRLRPVCSPTLFPKLDLQRRDRTLRGVTLLHEDDGAEWDRWAGAARASLEGTQFVKIGSLAQAIAASTQGKGIALASDVLTRGLLTEGRLIQPFNTTIMAAGKYYLVRPAGRAMSDRMSALLGDLQDYLSGRPG